ncbi:MAG: helix-turn-helix transcriptional regulator [Clostridiales bacterium]|nr:helix-turn-helix transcriptional regulator [Clostridiales bacterium]
MYRRIRDLREDNDLSQRQMAEYLGCSQRVYSNYECGDVQIPIPLLIEVSKYYGVSVDYLLELTDEKKPYPKRGEKKRRR